MEERKLKKTYIDEKPVKGRYQTRVFEYETNELEEVYYDCESHVELDIYHSEDTHIGNCTDPGWYAEESCSDFWDSFFQGFEKPEKECKEYREFSENKRAPYKKKRYTQKIRIMKDDPFFLLENVVSFGKIKYQHSSQKNDPYDISLDAEILNPIKVKYECDKLHDRGCTVCCPCRTRKRITRCRYVPKETF